jgi:hypothetical protein
MRSGAYKLRIYFKDRVFLFLGALSLVLFFVSLLIREASIERTPLPFNLVLLFFIVNTCFAIIALPREPLLAYMFLTASILMNGTLYFFFRYLLSVLG